MDPCGALEEILLPQPGGSDGVCPVQGVQLWGGDRPRGTAPSSKSLHHVREPHAAGWSTASVGDPGRMLEPGTGACGLLPGHVLSRGLLG